MEMQRSPFSLFNCLCLSLLAIQPIIAQEGKAIDDVKSVLQQQAIDWNNGNIDAFMSSYWKSDQLQFIGASGVTYGWQNTLEGYKKRYPDRQTMGQLHFDIINVDQHSPNIISLVGKFSLKRAMGDLTGHFLLLFKKIEGQWLIIADHTSAEQ
ncbi:MAG: DUF4440 domain-containing protein [Bacteroidota bacterium]